MEGLTFLLVEKGKSRVMRMGGQLLSRLMLIRGVTHVYRLFPEKRGLHELLILLLERPKTSSGFLMAFTQIPCSKSRIL